MNPAAPHDPIAALNQVLSDVIDEVQEVKQANRKVPATHALHAWLDELFGDLRTWATLIMDEDQALGVSPLGRIPSVAGRNPPNLWPDAASDEEVRRIVGGHLDRLAQHVAAALSELENERSRAALAEVQRGVRARQQALSEL